MKHKHCKILSKKCKLAITLGAQVLGVSRVDFHNMFVFDKNEHVTSVFWDVLYGENPDLKEYSNVDFCHSCKSFVLY